MGGPGAARVFWLGSSKGDGDNLAPPTGRAARWALLCAVGASVPFYLFFARRQWFWGGEWTFLAARDLSSFHDMVRPYNQHWETIPIVVFQLLFFVFRLRTYVPYQLPVIALHGTAALLLWTVMRRADIRPWFATIAAIAFVYFGHGRQDIVLAFQFGFDSALVLGLCAVLLVDHRGAYDRRDVLAVACSMLALLCSGVAVTMIVVAAIVVFFRRGLTSTIVYAAPLAIVYLAWYVGYASANFAGAPRSSIATMVGFVGSGLAATFGALGSMPVAGWALVAVMVLGVMVAWRTRSLGATWTLPLSLAVGALVFLSVTAFGRASAGTGAVHQSRYVDIAACLLLPLLAKSADTIALHYRHASVAVVAVLVVGMPSNLAAAGPANGPPTDRQVLVAVATSPMADSIDPRHAPDVIRYPSVTMGWLRNEVGHDGLPRHTSIDQPARATADVRLEIQQFGLHLPLPPCHLLARSETLFLAPHEDLSFLGQELLVSAATGDGPSTVPFTAITGSDGAMLRALTPLKITLRPSETPTQVCRQPNRNG